uniref:Uncharacterized protein n=2 Tax=Meloidogyne enterolobii TaxID=390850 RepID=A0A6V7VSS0_MELEN|nr:unnamed protein product [Meloidogyne enterolobii]
MLSATFTAANFRNRSLSHNSIINKNNQVNQQNFLNKENDLFRHRTEFCFENRLLPSSKNINPLSSSLSSQLAQNKYMSKSLSKKGCVKKELRDMFNVFVSMAKSSANGALINSGSQYIIYYLIKNIIKDNFVNKEQLIIALIKQERAKSRLIDSYKLLQYEIKQMKEEYNKSKKQNLIGRYINMQRMIYNLIQVERQYWQMYDIPTQAISETPFDYVIRISELIDERNIKSNSTSFTKNGGTIKQLLGASISIAERTKEVSICNLLRAKSLEDLNEIYAQLSIELYKIINKYLGLRLAIHELSKAYKHTRYYPLIPRYNLLKAMIKKILRTPTVLEQEI